MRFLAHATGLLKPSGPLVLEKSLETGRRRETEPGSASCIRTDLEGLKRRVAEEKCFRDSLDAGEATALEIANMMRAQAEAFKKTVEKGVAVLKLVQEWRAFRSLPIEEQMEIARLAEIKFLNEARDKAVLLSKFVPYTTVDGGAYVGVAEAYTQRTGAGRKEAEIKVNAYVRFLLDPERPISVVFRRLGVTDAEIAAHIPAESISVAEDVRAGRVRGWREGLAAREKAKMTLLEANQAILKMLESRDLSE